MKKFLLSYLLILTSTITAMAGLSVSANSSTICNGSCGTITATAIGGTPAYSYSWNPSSLTGPGINVCPTITTTYTVFVTDGSGATASAVATITVNPDPGPVITGNMAICSGSSTTLTSNAGGTYAWNTGQTIPSVTVNPTITTSYTVVVTTNGCTGSATAQITVNPVPTPAITGITNICSGQSTTLTASTAGPYSWSTGETTSSITVSPVNTKTYSVSVTVGGCTGIASLTVTVFPHVIASITGNNVCAGQTVTLTANGGTNYLWSTGATTKSITDMPLVTTTYTVIVSVGSCADTATYTVIVTCAGIKETNSLNALVKVYPNPFTDNTTFSIQSTKNETYSFELIDILGKQVRSIKEITTKEFQISRNGLQNGIYFYKIYNAESSVSIGKLEVK